MRDTFLGMSSVLTCFTAGALAAAGLTIMLLAVAPSGVKSQIKPRLAILCVARAGVAYVEFGAEWLKLVETVNRGVPINNILRVAFLSGIACGVLAPAIVDLAWAIARKYLLKRSIQSTPIPSAEKSAL